MLIIWRSWSISEYPLNHPYAVNTNSDASCGTRATACTHAQRTSASIHNHADGSTTKGPLIWRVPSFSTLPLLRSFISLKARQIFPLDTPPLLRDNNFLFLTSPLIQRLCDSGNHHGLYPLLNCAQPEHACPSPRPLTNMVYIRI